MGWGHETSRRKLEDLAPQIQTLFQPYHTLDGPAMLKLDIYFHKINLFFQCTDFTLNKSDG